jgi:hypothetical protein
MNLVKHFFYFRHPTTILVAGPTQAGKTEFVIELLRNRRTLFRPFPEKVYYAYGQKNEKQQKEIQKIVPDVEFFEGCPNIDHIDPAINNLLILDDLMDEIGKNQDCSNLFTRGSHHKNITVIGIIHNLFNQQKYSKTISINTLYYVILKNPRDNQQIAHFGRQIFPNTKNFIPCALKHATQRPFNYLIIDLHTQTPDSLRVTTGIFPHQIPILYIPS